jgi:MFS family permease
MRMQGRWTVLATVSLAFFFVTATTFTSLAVVLFTMCAQLHWSQTEAGFSFSLLGLACGLSSPLPAIALRWIGARWTVAGGALLLSAGFLIAGLSQGIWEFFGAVILLGIAFSLLAPVPGMALLPRWFPDHTPRIIGVYFMSGSAGGVLGPVLVEASVAWTQNWRLHWALMAGAAALLALLCALLVRDRSDGAIAAEQAGAPEPVPFWTVRKAIATPLFLVTAFAMMVVQTGLTVLNSSLLAHLHLLGAPARVGALGLGTVALAGTVAKGVAGVLSERVHPLWVLAASLVVNGAAFLLFGLSHGVALNFLAAMLFGIGWGTAWLSAHLLLLRRFGRAVTPDLVAFATTLTTFAVIGPAAAGIVADRTGSFAPIYLTVGALFAVALVPALLLRREARIPQPAGAVRPPALRPTLPGGR